MEETSEKKNKKRDAPRNPTEAAITCRPYASTGAICESDGVMRNFSSGGSYIETTDKFKSGTILIVRMVRYPTMPSSMAGEELPRSICLAEVKWRQELADENDIRFGIGLRYLDYTRTEKSMTTHHQNPRILVVTPEVTFVRHGMGPGARFISARAGGLGDICSAYIHALYEHGLDVHLALPNYRNVIKVNAERMPGLDIHSRQCELPESHIHLAQNRSFYYHPKLFATTDWENVRIALAFQREVINRIIPEVQPDLIHCYDWMTG